MPERRLEILGGGSIIAVPLRIPPIYWPHAALVVFILLAWVWDFGLSLWGWFG